MRALLIAFLMTTSAVAADVTATRLDGGTVTGELKGWDKSLVTIATKSGEEKAFAKDLLSLRWPDDPAAASPGTGSPVVIELTDGTIVPVSDFELRGSKVVARIKGDSSGHEASLTLSRRQLAAVRLVPIEGALSDQWHEIRNMKPVTDVLVLLKRNGQSLDYAEGVLGDMSPEKIDFKLDEDVMQIDRSKIAGLIFFQRANTRDSESNFVVEGRGGLKANVVNAKLNGESLTLATAGGTQLDWPLDDIVAIDFSAGKLAYLSDLQPASMSTTPLISLPAGASLSGKYLEPRRDKSAYGGPLVLGPANDSSDIAARTFNKGLAVRSRTELIYRLPAGYKRLNSIVGIDPTTRANGKVRLEILGDERPLFDAELAGTDPPRELNIDIDGVKRLKLIVDYGDNLDTGDWLNLCELRISK